MNKFGCQHRCPSLNVSHLARSHCPQMQSGGSRCHNGGWLSQGRCFNGEWDPREGLSACSLVGFSQPKPASQQCFPLTKKSAPTSPNQHQHRPANRPYVATKAAAEGTPSPLVNCWEIVYILLFYSAKKKGSLLYQKKKTLSFDLSHVVAYSVLLRIDPIELKGLLLEKKHPGRAFLFNSLHAYIIVEPLQAKLIKSNLF